MLSLKTNNFLNQLRLTLRAHQNPLLIISFTFGAYFTNLFSHLLEIKPDGIYAGHVHVWGDWSLHIAMANIFAYNNPATWFSNHPYFGGGKLTYGFLTNLISGLLIRAGWPLPTAFLLPSIIFAFLLLFGIYFVYYQILESKKLAITSLTIFFLSSGPGFLKIFEIWKNNPSWEFLLYPTKDFSRLEEYQWLAGNVVNGMLMPQRAFLLGMAIATWSLAILLYVLRHPALTKIEIRRNQQLLFIAGLLAGILPITHMHSLIALILISGFTCIAEFKRWKELSIYVLTAGILSSILYFKFIAGGIENPEFMQLLIGWTAPKTWLGWVTMWGQIWGIFTPLAILGLLIIKNWPARTKLLFFSFFLIFILGNLILFQPIQWDNSKLFLWTYFGWSALVTIVLGRLTSKSWPGKILAVILYLIITLTGCFELMRLQRFDKNTYLMTPMREMKMGEYIRQMTDEKSMFLTNASHNHPVSLWGARPILLGYPAWAWNFGFLYAQRLHDMRTMLAGNSRSIPLMRQYQIDYVAIGSGEIADLDANEHFFQQRFPLIYSDPSYRIYDVRSIKEQPVAPTE